jgi:hypothetical protein
VASFVDCIRTRITVARIETRLRGGLNNRVDSLQ